MRYNPDIHKRHTVRLKGYDYSQAGAYFVTICARLKEHYFGNIIKNKMICSAAGEISRECWLKIPDHFENVKLDEFVIMPNHIHGILFITDKIKFTTGTKVGEGIAGEAGKADNVGKVGNVGLGGSVGTDYNLSLL